MDADGDGGRLHVSGRLRERAEDESGMVLVLMSSLLVVLLAFAAFVVDIGLAYNERRQDQSAADAGILAGTQNVVDGEQAVADEARKVIRENLRTSYSNAEWDTLWRNCKDPGHYGIRATVGDTPLECVSFHPAGTVRVRVPTQLVETAFAKVVGFDTFKVSATAEASVDAGVLPFALLAGAGTGTEICLRTATNGQAIPPCTGSAFGNFGPIASPQLGNRALGTEGIPCDLNKNDQLSLNISVGIDHFIRAYKNQQGEILDSCTAFGANTLETVTGVGSSLLQGLVTQTQIGSRIYPGRLRRTDNATRGIRIGGTTYQIDNRPLWEYIPTGKGSEVPTACHRETFDTVVSSQYDGVTGTQQLKICLSQYQSSGSTGVLFDLDADGDVVPDILDAVRLAPVPQFEESSLPNGTSATMRIKEFRTVWIQGLWFGCNANSCSAVHEPGEGTAELNVGGGANTLDQMSSFLLPNSALPTDVHTNGANGKLGPYRVTLSR